MTDIQWWLELLLIGLLLLTVFHALRLERALGVLRRDRTALEEMVSGFNESTRQAEGGIERLRVVADGAGRQIARHVDQAKVLKSDLAFLAERGEKLADQLEKLIKQARPLAQMAGGQSSGAPAEPVRPVPRVVASSAAPAAAREEEGEGRVRSQAEKDLLRALRMAR